MPNNAMSGPRARGDCRHEYVADVDDANRSAIRASRLAKILPLIKAGGGLNDWLSR